VNRRSLRQRAAGLGLFVAAGGQKAEAEQKNKGCASHEAQATPGWAQVKSDAAPFWMVDEWAGCGSWCTAAIASASL